MNRSLVNRLKCLNMKRHHRWWVEGKKDGMCGIYRDLAQVPKLYREAYNSGHAYGAISREAAYYA